MTPFPFVRGGLSTFRRTLRQFIVALAILTTSPEATSAQSLPSENTFTIYIRSQDVGTETYSVERSDSGWAIRGSGRLNAPMNLVTNHFEVTYDATWRPIELTVDATANGLKNSVHTVFRGTTATSEITQGPADTTDIDTITEDAIVLLDNFFGGYEALAGRLGGVKPGTVLPIYFARQSQIEMRVEAVSDERIQLPGRTISAHRYRVVFLVPDASVVAEIWSDERHRLLRLALPASSVEAVREDLASPSLRRQTVVRPGDEQVSIAAAGFSLGATISKPSEPPPRRGFPAIVLTGGWNQRDRDEVIAGVPVFGHLAGALADSGFLVVRYDKRGIALSGGRSETATIADYAEDVRSVVRYLGNRRDVDEDRITVIGYAEGGWVALAAAAVENRIRAVALVAAPGTTGAELVLEQQRQILQGLSLPEAEKQQKIALQAKINAAAASGTGWEDVPPELRRQAESPLFRSILTFDPAEMMPRVRQPLLIVHPERDREIDGHHAGKLESLARERRGNRQVEVARVAGVNHLLTLAESGEVAEYDRLPDRTPAAAVVAAIVTWLLKTVPGRA